MIKLHHHTAAERIARDHGLEILSSCHASIPAGVPHRDHYGNFVNAFSVYIGTKAQRGQLPKNHAYGLLVQPIHDHSCDIASVLIDIAEKLVYDSEFSDRQTFEDYAIGDDINRAPVGYREQLHDQYRDFKNTAARARACLSPEVITKLETLLNDA